jgi:hypothetical protein
MGYLRQYKMHDETILDVKVQRIESLVVTEE